MIGVKLSPVLVEIEETIMEFEAYCSLKPDYPDEAFRAALRIFMSVFMDKIFNLQSEENMDMNDRCNMAKKAGEDLKDLIKTYTNIDTKKLYQ